MQMPAQIVDQRGSLANETLVMEAEQPKLKLGLGKPGDRKSLQSLWPDPVRRSTCCESYGWVVMVIVGVDASPLGCAVSPEGERSNPAGPAGLAGVHWAAKRAGARIPSELCGRWVL